MPSCVQSKFFITNHVLRGSYYSEDVVWLAAFHIPGCSTLRKGKASSAEQMNKFSITNYVLRRCYYSEDVIWLAT
jgi:hypothetical protein